MFETGEFPVDGRVHGTLLAALRYVVGYPIAGDVDSSILAELLREMAQGAADAGGAAPAIGSIVSKQHRGQVLESSLLHVRANKAALSDFRHSSLQQLHSVRAFRGLGRFPILPATMVIANPPDGGGFV